MARLDKLPEMAIIDMFRGTLDFYYCMGIPCVRKWPHWPKRNAYPLEKANQDAFGHAQRSWKPLPEYVKEMYRQMAASTSVTGRDIFTRAYMNVGRSPIPPA